MSVVSTMARVCVVKFYTSYYLVVRQQRLVASPVIGLLEVSPDWSCVSSLMGGRWVVRMRYGSGDERGGGPNVELCIQLYHNSFMFTVL